MEAIPDARVFLYSQLCCWLVFPSLGSHGLGSNAVSTVYFLYPETRGVRLEDMNMLFGDATSVATTPATRAETGSLIAASSPIPSMDLRRGVPSSVENGLGQSSAIPGLDIDPPNVNIRNGVPQYSGAQGSDEGVGGWISRMVTRSTKGKGSNSGTSSRYKPLDQEDE